MTYEIEPKVVRLFRFENEGGALAAVDMAFGPIIVSTKLVQGTRGYFLSLPSRHSQNNDRWYEQVAIADPALREKARLKAVSEYERLCREKDLVAV